MVLCLTGANTISCICPEFIFSYVHKKCLFFCHGLNNTCSCCSLTWSLLPSSALANRCWLHTGQCTNEATDSPFRTLIYYKIQSDSSAAISFNCVNCVHSLAKGFNVTDDHFYAKVPHYSFKDHSNKANTAYHSKPKYTLRGDRLSQMFLSSL